MWKLLRNVILAAVFVAGSLKLLAWYAVRQDSQRVIAGLAPYVQLKYAGISAGLNGSVTLDDVSATTAGTHKTYRARQLTFITPGLHWLLRRALLHENNLPQQFGIVVEGIELPRDLAWMDPRFLDQHSFAPFAAVGCGVDRFSAADYSKLGIGLRGDSERLDYSYNDATHILNTTLRLDAPGATGVVIAAEFSRFDPDQLRAPGWLTKLRLDQASVTYTDRGFQRARNRFCAARESISQSAFVDQHVTDVRALLKQHRITPNDALVELYRTVASEGGQVSVLSLPSKDFIPGSWKVLSANEVWRQLDVTARYGDSPPVMFGLDFATAPTVIAATTEESGAVAHDTG